jgi:hypothetical protein
VITHPITDLYRIIYAYILFSLLPKGSGVWGVALLHVDKRCTAFLQGQGPDPMGRLADKTAEEELAEALRARAAGETPDTSDASATSDAAPQR